MQFETKNGLQHVREEKVNMQDILWFICPDISLKLGI